MQGRARPCNPPTLQPEESGGQASIPGRAPPLERHDKGSWISRFAISMIPVLGAKTH